MYDKLKVYNGKKYSGMRIGRSHKWHYDNGIWYEQKLTPDKWQINYQCVKQRARKAPVNSGANIGSGYHWYIIADQKAMKMDSNRYQTIMDGFKFKVGHKRPTWKKWSYDYQAKKSYKEKVIQILENLLLQLKSE